MSTATATETSVVLIPLDDRVVVRKDIPPETSDGGIYIPEGARKDVGKPLTGTVIAVGPGRQTESGGRIALTLAVGDDVILGKYAGTDLDVDGDKLTIIKESDVLAKIGTVVTAEDQL